MIPIRYVLGPVLWVSAPFFLRVEDTDVRSGLKRKKGDIGHLWVVLGVLFGNGARFPGGLST